MKSENVHNKREIEQSEARDKLAKVLAGMVPLGSSAYELLTTIVVPLHEKKKREFLNDLADRLKKLEVEGKINYQELAESEEFNTIITKAILMAQQNHQEEKIEALKSIAVNSAKQLKNSKLMFDWNHRFLYLVDRFSPFHILLLKTFKSPEDVVEERSTDLWGQSSLSTKELFFLIYPEFKDRVMLIEQCWKELIDEGLISNRGFEQVIHKQNSLLILTTDFGNKFLGMIESEE